MQKLLTPLAIILAGVLIALSNLYINGKMPRPFLKSDQNQLQTSSKAGPTLTPTVLGIKTVPLGSAPFLGKADAPVVVVEFSDFQCPFCAAVFGINNEVAKAIKAKDPSWEPSLAKLKKDYIDRGLIKFVYKDFAFLGDESKAAANAALCARDQGKFWEYHDQLFQNQKGENGGAFTNTNLKKLAQGLGLAPSQFDSCVDDRKHLSQVEESTNQLRLFAVGNNLPKIGTPAFVINDQIVPGGAVSYSVLKALIDGELAKR